MKKNLIFLLLVFLMGCAKEDPKLEMFNPESFAYGLDEGWELNATVRIKGFNQIENENDEYSSKISYEVDFITPEKDTLKKFDFGTLEELSEEELTDLGIEVQAEFDKNFSPGKYELIFFANDENSEYINKDTLHMVIEYSN